MLTQILFVGAFILLAAFAAWLLLAKVNRGGRGPGGGRYA